MPSMIDPNVLTFDALPAIGKLQLAQGVPVTATGTGTATSGFSGVAALLAKVTVDVVAGAPTVTVKVQHSPDGTTWADLISFNAATADGVQIDRGETPDDYVRASWTVSGSGSALVTVEVAPVAAAGGGGSQPSATDGTTTIAAVSAFNLPPGTLTDLGGGVAGVGLVLRLVQGSFRFDDPGLTTTGVDWITLPQGSVLLDMWFSLQEEWDEISLLTVAFAEAANPVNEESAGVWASPPDLSSAAMPYEGTTDASSGPGDARTANAVFTAVGNPAKRLLPRTMLLDALIRVYASGGSPTTGQMTLFGIVASPAM